jgi:hypothetical protein
MSLNPHEDIMADLQSAVDAQSDTEAPETVEAAPDAPEPVEAAEMDTDEAPRETVLGETTSSVPPRGRKHGPDGRFVPKGEADKTAAVKPTPSAMADAAKKPLEPAAAVKPPVAAAPTDLRPPPSLKPQEKEAFKTWPREVQELLHRREREAAVAIQRSAEPAKLGQAFQQLAQAHAPVLQAMGGGNALQAVDSLLQTARVLHYGSPAQKADALHSILTNYGVDVDLVNARLEGRPGQQQQAQQPFDINAITQQVRQSVFGELRQQQQERHATAANTEVAQFRETAEFFDDVAPRMRALILAESEAGSTLTLKQAYDWACKLTPDVAAVLEQRAKAEQANATQASTQRARAAGSTIRSAAPAPRAEQQLTGTDDILEDVKAAMAAAGRR